MLKNAKETNRYDVHYRIRLKLQVEQFAERKHCRCHFFLRT